MARVNLDLIISMIHAHAIKQMDKSSAFRICTVLGYAQQYWFENHQQKKPRSYTPYTLSTEHTESTNYLYYVLHILWQASLQNPILIWWAWQQIILILVGQIKQKQKKNQLASATCVRYVKFKQKSVTISVSHQPTSQIKQKHKTSDFSSLNE